MTAPLPTLADLGPLSDRELRIHALGYAAGREDGHAHGFTDGVLTVLDAEASPVQRRPVLRLVAS